MRSRLRGDRTSTGAACSPGGKRRYDVCRPFEYASARPQIYTVGIFNILSYYIWLRSSSGYTSRQDLPANLGRFRLMRNVKTTVALFLLLGAALTGLARHAANAETTEPEASELLLGTAAICEAVQNSIPFNEAIVFSISRKKLYCYTDFVAVPEKSFIYHNWYLRDEKRASVKLQLNHPRWATFSYVAFKTTDLGPWRVEVTDAQGNVLHILRFSIVD